MVADKQRETWAYGNAFGDAQAPLPPRNQEKWADMFFDNFVPSVNHQNHELQDDLLFLVRKQIKAESQVGALEVRFRYCCSNWCILSIILPCALPVLHYSTVGEGPYQLTRAARQANVRIFKIFKSNQITKTKFEAGEIIPAVLFFLMPESPYTSFGRNVWVPLLPRVFFWKFDPKCSFWTIQSGFGVGKLS